MELNREPTGGLCLLSGRELRRVLCVLLTDNGRPLTITELRAGLARSGFAADGRASKTISDALRWEIGRGRAVRVGKGSYAPGRMPRSTEYRIRKQVRELRATAA